MMAPLENPQLADPRSVRASSITSNRSSKRRKNNRKKKAKEWTYYIETLKSSIDCLYEICRADQSIIGCKEAIFYLQDADKDFQSLIEAINLEKNFSKEEPQAVAWEIRKSMNSPTHKYHEKSAQKMMEALPMSPMVINELSFLGKDDNGRDDPDDGWQVVTNRRRKSTSSSLADRQSQEKEILECESVPPRPPSVYERLSSGISCRKHGIDSPTRVATKLLSRGAGTAGRLTCPRSAMDLPQTKASMAKISYCRQRLWEKDVKPNLAEKLARQKRERVRPAAPAVCRINFSDPAAVRKRALEYSENLKQLRKKPAVEARSLQSLQSINENGEMDSGDVVPCDPKPSEERDITTRSEPPRMECWSPDLDLQWREMTEEEQSLAQEEESLNLEIEKAESELESMDAELVRQVDEEAEDYPIQEPAHDPNEAAIARAEMFKKLEDEFKNFMHISWSEMMEKEYNGPIHEPGMVAEKHEKMCSPTRRRCEKDHDDFSKRHIDKIKKADEAREKLQQERRQKLHELAQKRDEIREKQAELIERKRVLLEKRMERAQENRDKNITEIVKKAKSDEQRVIEIQFINTMQDDNMRYIMQSKEQHREERKQILVEERAKKNEEKALKEQAVEERRRAAEQKRMKKLQESEEKRARQTQMALEKKKAKQKKERAESSLLEPPAGYFTLDSLAVRQSWPASSTLDEPVKCTKCNTVMSSKLDCFIHVLGEDHLAKADITPVNVNMDKLAKELGCLKMDKTPRPTSSSKTTKQPSSPRKAEIQQKDFDSGNDYFNKCLKPVECQEDTVLVKRLKCETLTEEVVAAISEALKCIQKGNQTETANSFLPAAEALVKLIIAADDSTPLTNLLRLCSLVEKCCVSLSFALKCLFSSHVFQLFDSLNRYSQENPSNPYFSAVMDVCLSILQPVLPSKELADLGIPEETVTERIALIYETISAFAQNIPSLVGRGDSAAKWTRIHNFASYFINRGTEETSLSMVYIDTILRETYEAFRISTGNDAVDKANRCDSDVTSKLANRMMHILERLWQSRQPELWAALFDNPTRNFRFCLLCTELMRRCIARMRTDASSLRIIPQLLFLLRYFTAKNPSHQILCMIGGEKSTIATICQLPNEFFNQPIPATQSIPTLVLMTYESQHSLRRLLTKRICTYIINFIKNVRVNQQNKISLQHVISEDSWQSAIKFYQSSQS